MQTRYDNSRSRQIEDRQPLFQLQTKDSMAHLRRWLQQFAAALVQALTTQEQIRIWTSHDHDQTFWHVRDPFTGKQHLFASEQALRVWLEQRYYQ
jgi:hypothetical protein